MDFLSILLGGIVGFIIGFVVMKIQSLITERHIRQNAIRGSKNAIFGEVYEKILPSLPQFPYSPKDMVFVGKGCDYIIFDGLSEGMLKEVVFLEIKSGKARLNRNEQAIKRAIDAKKIRFTEYRIESKKTVE